MANVKTDKYNPRFDLTSEKYRLDPKEALTLHGKKHYIQDNYLYWREANSKELKKSQIIQKFGIKNVEVIGKLYQAIYSGYDTFGVSIYVDDKDAKQLHVGNSKKYIKETLEDYIVATPFNKVKKLLISVNNLQRKNYKVVMEKLNQLDKKYNIREKAILVVEPNSKIIQELIENKWKVAIDVETSKEVKKEVGKWKDQIMILCSDTQYKTLKSEYVGGKFIVNMKNLNLKDSSFIQKIQKESFIKDKNLLYILVDYPSLYEL
jgi:hypothetical protein